MKYEWEFHTPEGSRTKIEIIKIIDYGPAIYIWLRVNEKIDDLDGFTQGGNDDTLCIGFSIVGQKEAVLLEVKDISGCDRIHIHPAGYELCVFICKHDTDIMIDITERGKLFSFPI